MHGTQRWISVFSRGREVDQPIAEPPPPPHSRRLSVSSRTRAWGHARPLRTQERKSTSTNETAALGQKLPRPFYGDFFCFHVQSIQLEIQPDAADVKFGFNLGISELSGVVAGSVPVARTLCDPRSTNN